MAKTPKTAREARLAYDRAMLEYKGAVHSVGWLSGERAQHPESVEVGKRWLRARVLEAQCLDALAKAFKAVLVATRREAGVAAVKKYKGAARG